jgi:hypothetical protein
MASWQEKDVKETFPVCMGFNAPFLTTGIEYHQVLIRITRLTLTFPVRIVNVFVW